MIRNMRKLIGLAVIALPTIAGAFAPTNFFLHHDSALRFPVLHHNRNFALGVYKLEYGREDEGRSWDGKERNILQLHDTTESLVSAFRNPVTANVKGIFDMLSILGPDPDNGVRGQLCLNGKFSEIDATFFAGWTLPINMPGALSLVLYVPVVNKKVSDIVIKDLTPVTGDKAFSGVLDAKVKVLANKLQGCSKTWGCLDLCGSSCGCSWQETGIGDIPLLLEWRYDAAISCREDEEERARTHKDYRASFFARVGVIFPAAEEKDEDKAFSMALGNDGAWGLPISGGFSFNPGWHFKLGMDVDIVILFDHTKVRRLKTHPDQTEFLLFNKGLARKEHGVTWQLNAYAQAYHFIEGFSLQAAYQYVKHERSHLVPLCKGFDCKVVDCARSLLESDVHNVILRANYDWCHDSERGVVPQIGFFYKFGMGGKNMIDNDTVGGQLSINF